MSLIDLSRKAGESELAYIQRLGMAKQQGLIDMTWGELATVFNKNLREPGQEYNESTYRKKFASMQKFGEEFGTGKSQSEEAEELKLLKEGIQKERRKLFDQRREYNKLLTSDARAEHLTECMIEAANAINQRYPLLDLSGHIYNCKKEALVCFSDWHYGLVTDNIWNKYNVEICKDRVAKFVKYTKTYLLQNNVDTAHIVLLGDSANGCIHTSCRIKSEEDTCDQIMHVSEIIAQAINEISLVVNKVNVYSCYGNHLRSVQKKEDSIHSDNMEKIIPWWLEQRLKENKKISINYSEYKEFTYINILGYSIVCVHGDNFNFKDICVTVNSLFSKLFGHQIDYTVSGDKHHLEEYGQYGIESILVRSLCGTDDYANSKHLYDKPGQTLIIFNDEYGRECTYHIPLE